MYKNEKGITLVALVVTVVILLILAGVALNLVIGENGIITKAKTSQNVYDNAVAKEQEMLDGLAADINDLVYGDDLQKLNEFFALGIDTIMWFEEEEPYDEGYNPGIEPIPDANISIIDIGSFELGDNSYNICQYHNKYYQIAWDPSIGEDGDFGEVTRATELTMVFLDIYNGNSEIGAARVLMEPYSIRYSGNQEGYYTYGNRFYCVTEWTLAGIQEVTLPEYYVFYDGYLLEYDETILTWGDLVNSTEFNILSLYYHNSNPDSAVITSRGAAIWDPVEENLVCGTDYIHNGRVYEAGGM